MNKTVTINISGIIFHIEEDAFETLSKYLSTIRGYFVNAQDKEEIMSDIEARIAELLKEKVSDFKQVVLMSDVDRVMNIMGKPEDFAGDEAQSNNSGRDQESTTINPNRKKRFYRDPDDKMIGGVCSGISNYFDIDPTIVRVILAILAFTTFGVLITIYIILWVIIPEAKTTAEKLEMRGESIDINNISKTVKEEAEQLKSRMEKFGKGNRSGERVGDFFRQFFSIVLKVLVKLVGIFLVGVGVALMIGVIAIFLNKATIDGTNAQLYIDDFLGANKFYTFIGLILLLGVPAVMFLYKGVKMLFNIKFHNKWLNIGSGALWTIGLIMLVVTGINAGKEFKEEGRIKTPFVMKNAKQDTLYITADLSNKILEQFSSYEEVKHMGKIRVGGFRNSTYEMLEINGEKQVYGAAQVNVVESETDSFEINIIKTANGLDKRAALERARKISYSISQKDSLITIEPLFKIEKGEKLRAQDVLVQIKVPKGKVIKLDKSLYSFLHDVDNVTNTWDGDMVDRRWKMTAKGLQCIDCEDLDINEDFDIDVNIGVPPIPPVAPHGININDKDAKVVVDEKGINVKSKDTRISIDKNGIQIETKDKKEKN
jgi:phage shock protein PspC (stress-responsive transcriptional regulator)